MTSRNSDVAGTRLAATAGRSAQGCDATGAVRRCDVEQGQQASWLDSSAFKRAQIRQRILGIWQTHVDFTTFIIPARAQSIVRRESGDIHLTVQAHRKFLSLAQDFYRGAGRQWLAVFELDSEC